MTFGECVCTSQHVGSWLFDRFGIMWVVVVLFVLLRVFDKLSGKPLEALFTFRGVLSTEYYPSLWARYHDPDFEKYIEEREQAYQNYTEYLHRAIREQGITTWRCMRWAKRHYNYKVLYNLEQDLDEEFDFIEGGYLYHDIRDVIFRK